MTSTDIQAIIFDCDGTLVDSEPLSLKVLVELVAEHGLDIPHDEAIQRWSGGHLDEIVIEIEARLGRALPGEFLSTFRGRQLARLATDVQPVHGANELLQAVGKPRCIASNAPRNKIQLCLQTTRLDHFFEVSQIFSAYEVEAWKPRPDLFLHAADQLGVAPERCAVVEDSEFGIEAGLAAGMQVFVYDPRETQPDRDGVHAVSRLTDLIPALA